MTDDQMHDESDKKPEKRARRGLLPGFTPSEKSEPDGDEIPKKEEEKKKKKLSRLWKKKDPAVTGRNYSLARKEEVIQETRPRDTGVSSLPVFTAERYELALEGEPGEEHVEKPERDRRSLDDIRLALYGETMQAWRLLTDVRFRVMSMLPAISIVAFIPLVLVVGEDRWVTGGAAALAVLGLVLVQGLHFYEKRNDGLYNELISRAKRIEAELGVETGIMLGRPASTSRWVDHTRSTQMVFWSMKLAWVVVAVVLVVSVVVGPEVENTSGSLSIELPG